MPLFQGIRAHKKPTAGRYLTAITQWNYFFFAGLSLFLNSAMVYSQTPLTLSDAVEKTLAMHPDTAVMNYKGQAARSRIEQASIGTSPEVILTIDLILLKTT